MKRFPERFAQRLPGPTFDLRDDPVSILGSVEEPREQDRLAHAAQPVQHHRLGGSSRLNAVERNTPALALWVAPDERGRGSPHRVSTDYARGPCRSICSNF